MPFGIPAEDFHCGFGLPESKEYDKTPDRKRSMLSVQTPSITNTALSKLAAAGAKLGAALAKIRGEADFRYGASNEGRERGIEGLVEDALIDIKCVLSMCYDDITNF